MGKQDADMASARKRLVFNFFIMDTPSHIFHGTWRHPQSRSLEYNDLDLWVELAQLAERGKMDGLFIADVFGMYESFGGTTDGIIKNAVQFPISDPGVIISAMAYATTHLGLIYTNSVLHLLLQRGEPFAGARQHRHGIAAARKAAHHLRTGPRTDAGDQCDGKLLLHVRLLSESGSSNADSVPRLEGVMHFWGESD
jgi:hypothetical protein